MKARAIAFTLIELLVVLAIIATLLVLVSPRYFGSLDRAKDTALRQNLVTLRDALDKYHEDKGRYPANLDELVTARYLRTIPIDPVTESNTSWIVLPPRDAQSGGVFDVKSGATGATQDGTAYADL